MLKLSEIVFQGDYKTQLGDIITKYRDTLRSYSLEARITVVDSLIDRYIDHTGERPGGRELYQLGSIIAYDYMEGDRRKNKSAVVEYPILTDVQLGHRKTGSHQRKGARGYVSYEVPLENAVNIGVDGVNYTPPKRYY